jgi:hypothetical protein
MAIRHSRDTFSNGKLQKVDNKNSNQNKSKKRLRRIAVTVVCNSRDIISRNMIG